MTAVLALLAAGMLAVCVSFDALALDPLGELNAAGRVTVEFADFSAVAPCADVVPRQE